MTITEGMRIFRLPNPTTAEDLGCRWSHVLNYGDKVLLAGYYHQPGKPSWFGAVYEHLDEDITCEGAIGLSTISDVAFEDEGAAIAWCIRQGEYERGDAADYGCVSRGSGAASFTEKLLLPIEKRVDLWYYSK